MRTFLFLTGLLDISHYFKCPDMKISKNFVLWKSSLYEKATIHLFSLLATVYFITDYSSTKKMNYRW